MDSEASSSTKLLKGEKRKRDLPLDEAELKRKAEKKERKRLKALAKEAAQQVSEEDGLEETVAVAAMNEPPKKKSKKSRKEKNVEVDPTQEASSSTATATAVASPTSTTVNPTPSETAAFLAEHSITIEGDVTPLTSFDQLDISPALSTFLNQFKAPTPIQACAWPALLAGQDVVGIAETGSGKTMAFALPATHQLISQGKKSGGVSVLVLAPTRELAIQSNDTFTQLGQAHGIKSVCVYGGASKDGQRQLMRQSGVKVIVATPGRLLDFIQEGVVDLSSVSYLVLDEADRMLDTGFENDIRKIIGLTKGGRERQTLMFSATWPDSVRRLASSFMRDPVRITVGSDDLTANGRVEQIVEVMGDPRNDPRQKENRLKAILQSLNHPKTTDVPNSSRILIFCLYKKETARVTDQLKWLKYNAVAIHGDLSQGMRESALESFKNGTSGLMVATDVAARGLDIPNVTAVINYTFPLTIEDYVHRIGRTGRAGKTGKSITFFTGEDHERALAGELMRVLKDSGYECEELKKFPMTVKKKEHGAYGAFFKDTSGLPTTGKKIKF
ncbi:RNA-dependent ATPase [Tulasnella sp. 330]|nr:RNA-dependent ATPase [Tulasnella sp. 330]KAG8869226.1 RNA-dependent ATPase [Tulasnella sp. 331]KAG8878246.1 RNA-dependent ATPase [Tulasnella sp. 332]